MILKTDRLYLRHFVLDDAKRMSEYRNKKEVSRYQTWNKYTLQDAQKRIAYCLNHPDIEEKGNYQFAIVLNDTNEIIGDLFLETNNKSYFALGYTLDSEYWNKGYATEMVSAFLQYMKDNYHYKKVMCYVYKDNYRSIHLLKKLGFKVFSESFFYKDIGLIKVL